MPGPWILVSIIKFEVSSLNLPNKMTHNNRSLTTDTQKTMFKLLVISTIIHYFNKLEEKYFCRKFFSSFHMHTFWLQTRVTIKHTIPQHETFSHSYSHAHFYKLLNNLIQASSSNISNHAKQTWSIDTNVIFPQ